MRPLVVIGAGGFGRETLDVVAAINEDRETYRLLGVIDSNPSAINLQRLEALGVEYLGPEEDQLSRHPGVRFVIGIGSPSVRRRVSDRLRSSGSAPATLIHPAAIVSKASKIAEGTVICAGVQVSTNVTIGTHCHLNPGAIVGHDSTLDQYVSVNPGAIVSGEVQVDEEVLVGAGAVILQGLHIGTGATIGAAACVVRDVAPHRTVKGVPAR